MQLCGSPQLQLPAAAKPLRTWLLDLDDDSLASGGAHAQHAGVTETARRRQLAKALASGYGPHPLAKLPRLLVLDESRQAPTPHGRVARRRLFVGDGQVPHLNAALQNNVNGAPGCAHVKGHTSTAQRGQWSPGANARSNT